MEKLQKAFDARAKKRNKIEVIKESKEPMDIYAKLEEIANGGYEKLDKADSSYFLKCFGLFDKGEDFMLRVRIPAGVLSYTQAKKLAQVAQKYANDYIDISTRMQVVLRYIKIEDIATTLKELDSVGLSGFQTGVDNTRNIVTDPLDTLAFDSIIPTKPIIDKLEAKFIKNPEWISTLPRKFNTGILGSLSNSCNIFGHDCSFVLAQKDGIFGFNVYLGARVGIQAKDANIFVEIDEVESFYEALLNIFKRYGYRDNRNKNRLHFLIQDVGIDTLVDAIKKEAKCDFKSAGVTMVQSQNISLGSNKVLQKDSTFAYKVIIPSGVFNGSDLLALTDVAKQLSDGDIRFTYDQNIYLTSIPQDRLNSLEESSIIKKYAKYNNPYFKDMIACAGVNTCSFGVIKNKPDAIEMANYLNSTLPIEDASIRMNWSACPKGCGVHGIADIGFEGCKARDDDGNRVDGVHIFMGGKITRCAKEAHTLHKSIPLLEAKYHIKYLLKPYSKYKGRTESFEEFESRFFSNNYTYQAIGFYTKINYILNEKLDLGIEFELEDKPKSSKKEEYEIFDFGLRLYKLLTGNKRYEKVDGLTIIQLKPTSIKRDEVSRLNSKVPLKLSEIIYNMTHEKITQRAQVFSELLVALKEI